MQVGGFKTATSQRKQKGHAFIQIKVYYFKKEKEICGLSEHDVGITEKNESVLSFITPASPNQDC